MESENIDDYDFGIIVCVEYIDLYKINKNEIDFLYKLNGYPITDTKGFVDCIKNNEHERFISESKSLLVETFKTIKKIYEGGVKYDNIGIITVE